MRRTAHSHEKARTRPGAAPGASIWFALFGAPTAWGVQVLASWLLIDGACEAFTVSGDLAALESVRWWTIGFSLFAAVIALLAALTSIRLYRRYRRTSFFNVDSELRQGFLAGTGFLVSGAFLLGILWAALAPWTLAVCEITR